MSVDARRSLAALVAGLALVATACGDATPIRVAVLAECTGPLASAREGMLAAAQLPFLERGAKARGKTPAAGIKDAQVAGRKVELIAGCTEVARYSDLIAETRRLVEEEGADIVVGPLGDSEGVVQARLADRYPDVTFVLGWGIAQEATLQRGRPNLFRFLADGPQTVAGLGAYAYRDLGWRRAALVIEDFPAGWETAAGFVTEFCALGGRIVDREILSDLVPARRTVAQVSPEVDGVAVLSTITDPTPFLSAYGRQVGDLPRHVVGGGAAFAWKSLALAGAAGTAVAYDLPPTSPRPAWRRQVRGFREAFPGLPTEFATDPLYMHLGTAMEAVAQGIERSHGELGRQQRLFRDALSELTLDAPAGPVRIDANGQAVVDIHIERVTADGRRAPLRLVEGVEQTFGGAFGRSTPPPTRALPRCERRPPPPWARG